MPHDFPLYAELWQEQIEPKELAELQAMGRKIARTAKRKRLVDFLLGLAVVGPACLVLWIYPLSLQARLGFALVLAIVIGVVWRRHQITRASRETDIHDPHVFFEKAIKNLRAEINLSTLSLYISPPGLVISFLLMGALDGFSARETIAWTIHHGNLVNGAIIFAVYLLIAAYFIRDNLKLREQLRRLESMSREWDEQQARDLEEGR